MAGGFSIAEDKIEKFKEFIIKKFKTKIENKNDEQSIYLDSQINASAINFDFYQKIEKLSPFGSGNPEPKFLLENMKVIKSFVVGETHIKSILASKEGLTIKTISFNSYDTDLGQFLLKDKNNTFNIVGKLSLNEWKGEKNVEFIIDDISVIKKKKITVPSSIG